MPQSAEWSAMKQALRTIVLPRLRAEGFRGAFPHLRRVGPEKTDLISFLSHGWGGGAFEVGASVVFPNAARPEETNFFAPDAPPPRDRLNWGDGFIRHGLPGIYAGAFFYVDTYRWRLPNLPGELYHYTALSPAQEKHLLAHLQANHYELVLKADPDIYERTAHEVLRQLEELLVWFEQMDSCHALRQWANG